MKKWFWIIVLLTIAVRGAVFVYYKPWSPSYDMQMAGEDPYLYHRLAIDLLATGHYGGNPDYDANFHSATVRPPGYPIFVAMIYALFGARHWIVLLTHIVLSTLTTGLIFATTKRFFNEASAVIAGALFALHPIASFTAATMYTETFFIFLLSLLFYLATIASEKIQRVSTSVILLCWLLIGSIAGFATVVRVSMLYFAPLLLLTWIGFLPTAMRLRLAMLITAIIGFVLPLVPWSLYNYNRFGSYRLSASGEYNLLVLTIGQAFAKGGLEEYRRIRREFIPLAMERMQRDGLDPQSQPLHRAKYYREVALEKLRENPGVVLQGFARGALKFWIVPSRASGESFIGNTRGITRLLFTGIFVYAILLQLVILFSALYGLRKLARQRQWLWVSTFLLAAFYFTLTAGAAGSSRFFLQVLPFILPISAYGIVNLMQARISHREGAAYET